MGRMEQIAMNNKKKKVDEEGVGIHSQVRKVKLEMEKINGLVLQQPEPRPAVSEINRHRRRSRSPLGLAQTPISVGN